MQRRQALRNIGLIGGSAALAAPMLTLLQSCKNTSRNEWQPSFFTDDQTQKVSALVDTILPATDTPGGLDVKVDVFLDLVFDKLYDEEGQKEVRLSLDQLFKRLEDNYGKPFQDMTQQERSESLKEEEKRNIARYNRGVWGSAVGEQEPIGFYRSLKSTILWGYFTSEEVGKNVLNYDPIPGAYKGCIPLDEVGRLWSL